MYSYWPEALQGIRIKYRWEALDAENEAIENAKKEAVIYEPETFENGDSLKQLLARVDICYTNGGITGQRSNSKER